MLEKSQRFFDHLDKYVESGEEFGLGELTTNLAFDVIGTFALTATRRKKHIQKNKTKNTNRCSAKSQESSPSTKTSRPSAPASRAPS